ncbi:MAG: hypothetical protein RI963_2124 [Planctomycetota bacterium]
MLRHLLVSSRLLLILPILGSLLLMVGVVVMGIAVVVVQEWTLLTKGDFSPKAAKALTLTVIETVDMFLLAAICYIVAVGLYKLFISQDEKQLLGKIRIENLADLETKIIGVVVVAMAVGFLGRATEAVDYVAVLQGGIGIAAVICALCLFLKLSASEKGQG